MSLFLRSGSRFSVTSEDALDLHKELPVGNYIVRFNPVQGFYLDKVESFEENGKIYGDTARNCSRIISTFLHRAKDNKSTGTMLSGEKGCGKTLLARMISIQLAKDLNIPTIIINEEHKGDDFNKFIAGIEQPTVILFDEFEKTYDKEAQESVLTLFDGTFPQKKLFLITCNDKYLISSHMKNRPGRIHYAIEYRGLSNEFITEYCQDNLQNKGEIPDICKFASLFEDFNFDMLKALVAEMNLYGEPTVEAVKLLNIKPSYQEDSKFTITVTKGGTQIPSKRLHTSEVDVNPTAEPFDVFITPDKSKGNGSASEVASDLDDLYPEDGGNWIRLKVTPSDMVRMDAEINSYVFKVNGFEITLTREKRNHSFVWEAF